MFTFNSPSDSIMGEFLWFPALLLLGSSPLIAISLFNDCCFWVFFVHQWRFPGFFFFLFVFDFGFSGFSWFPRSSTFWIEFDFAGFWKKNGWDWVVGVGRLDRLFGRKMVENGGFRFLSRYFCNYQLFSFHFCLFPFLGP